MSYVQYGYNSQENSAEALRNNLVKAVGFSPADLAANRSGKMSDKQMFKVLYGTVVPLMKLLIPLSGLIGLAVAYALAGPLILAKLSFLIKFSKYLIMGLGTLAFGLLALIMKSIFASGRFIGAIGDLMSGNAVRETARIRTSRGDEIEDGVNQLTKSRTMTYNLIVGERELPISKEAYDEITDWSEGGWFNVYYTPRSNFLLALEPASQDEVDSARSLRAA